MKKIPAAKFNAPCLTIIETVHATREPVLITQRGRPLAKVVPAGEAQEFLGRLKGVVKISGDIESPLQGAEAWEALR